MDEGRLEEELIRARSKSVDGTDGCSVHAAGKFCGRTVTGAAWNRDVIFDQAREVRGTCHVTITYSVKG